MSDNQPHPTPKPSSHGQYLDAATWAALKAAGFTDEQLYSDQPFGPIVFRYTRKQAIADGVLVDLAAVGLGTLLHRCGILPHCAMTSACFAAIIARKFDPGNLWIAEHALLDMLLAFRQAVLQTPRTNSVHFMADGIDGKKVAMWAHVGPGDEGEPVLTFMLEGED